MNKAFLIYFCFISLFLFCSCNMPQKEINEKSESDLLSTGMNYILIDSDNKLEVPNEFDLVINESIITKMADSDDLQIDLNLPKEEDSIYFILMGSIKNNSPSSIDLLELFKSSLVFDENYQYDTSFYADDNNELIPLKNKNFAIYASVPIEILASASQYEFRILLPSKYKSIIKSDEIRFQKAVSQYGSPENVANKHILAEMLENLVESYPRVLIFESEDDSFYRILGSYSFSTDDDLSQAGKRFIYNRHEILLRSPKNSNEYWNSEFIIGTPSINYSYKDGYVSTRFIIQYEKYDSILDKSYRLNAERTIIKSDNGTYENDNFSPTIIKMEDLSNLRNILQGNNLYFTKVNNDLETTVEINEPFKNTLLSLIEFFEKSADLLPLKEE